MVRRLSLWAVIALPAVLLASLISERTWVHRRVSAIGLDVCPHAVHNAWIVFAISLLGAALLMPYVRAKRAPHWWKSSLYNLALVVALSPLLLMGLASVHVLPIDEYALDERVAVARVGGRTLSVYLARCSCGVFDECYLAEELHHGLLFRRVDFATHPDVALRLLAEAKKTESDPEGSEVIDAQLDRLQHAKAKNIPAGAASPHDPRPS